MPCKSPLNRQIDFSGDALGRTVTVTGPLSRIRTASYDDDNRLATLAGASLSHDSDGNLLGSRLPDGPWGASGNSSGATGTYTWNARNQLTRVVRGDNSQQIDYSYDAEGNLISQTDSVAGTTRWVIDPDGVARTRVLARVAPDGKVTRYIHGLGLLCEVRQDASVRYYHCDQTGSTVALTDADETPWGMADYSPYGALQSASGELAGAGATPFLFVGAHGVLTDPATGLHQMRARRYSSHLRRFLSEDHIGFAGGSNFYAYCKGDPIMRVDPSGLLDNTTAFQLGVEWLSGTGPRHHDFTDGDPFAEQLRQHNHLQAGFQNAAQQAAAAAAQGQTSIQPIRHKYDLSGIEGVPKYLNDYSTLATGSATGNLAVTYLGSYRATMNVTNINAQAGTANVQVLINNSSNMASGTRPPVLGYTNFWQQNVGPAINSMFSSGPMSPTTQTIRLNHTVNFAPVQSTPFSGSGFGGLFNSGRSSNK